MVIRDIAWRDFPDLTENYLALYEEVGENPDLGISLFPQRPTIGEEAEWFSGLFRRVQEGNCVASVAEEDGRAVGLCNVDRKAPHQEAHHIGVLGIMVARPYRGRGIGRSLLRYAIARCREKFEILELSVFDSNVRARELYRSLGFRSWGVQPKAILREGKYTDLDHMILDLGTHPAK
jgi:ribosomal protein S18 acetylase RimI-like enzyme